ncbi:hypothetical protein E4U33_002862 [Claviceps sp. LM78 group G4]|nr:hypothetical protein E4U33_002862 [Claviceps sp. LM78 group G4]
MATAHETRKPNREPGIPDGRNQNRGGLTLTPILWVVLPRALRSVRMGLLGLGIPSRFKACLL